MDTKVQGFYSVSSLSDQTVRALFDGTDSMAVVLFGHEINLVRGFVPVWCFGLFRLV